LGLTQLSLEELMQLEVSTVSRRTEQWWTAPGAIDVVTDEDIRRSGVFELPDALRLAAGVHVAQPNAREWAVAIRGFNVVASNKLNVQMDGRSLYTPFFSGVLWDAQATMMEDIDRIEVMRGPAGALWGSYATNGFIQILTKPAWATQGTLVSGATGNELPGHFAVRHGGKLNHDTFYRVYAKYTQFDWSYDRQGRQIYPTSDFGQIGFRSDARRGQSTFTLQGDAYTNKGLPKDRLQNENSGGNLTGHWSRDLGPDTDLRVTSYYDYTSKRFGTGYYERRHTAAASGKFRTRRGAHDLQLGTDVLVSRDHVIAQTIYLDPPRRTFKSASLFAHDTFSLVPEHVHVTVGAQALHTNFSGWEVQPTVRAAWTPTPRTTGWAAVSRAVRTPIRVDEDLTFVLGNTPLFFGNDNLKSERVIAYELGTRFRLNERLAVTVSGFLNAYNDVRSYESTTSTFRALPWTFGNTTNVDSSGFESLVLFQPTAWMFVKATYRYLEFELTKDPGSGDFQNGLYEANDARHVGMLTWRLDLPRDVELDLVARGASRIPNPAAEGYVTLDARVAWHPRSNWELALIGRNLAEPQHREFNTPNSLNEEIARSFAVRTTWRF
jgi:iron complex outermembrane receptor protein